MRSIQKINNYYNNKFNLNVSNRFIYIESDIFGSTKMTFLPDCNETFSLEFHRK
jgi:hypothetical protein